MPNVLIAIPSSRGEILYQTRKSLNVNMFYAMDNGYKIQVIDVFDGPIHYHRNEAVKLAINGGFDFLVMFDGDMYFHSADIIYRMLKRFEQNDPNMVLAALAVQRKPPHEPVAFKRDDSGLYSRIYELKVGIHEVDAFGTGCFIAPVAALKKLSKPYFAFPPDPTNTEITKGEDVFFCENCQAHGVRVFVDYDVDVGHFEYVPYTVRDSEKIPHEQRVVWADRMTALNVRGLKNE